MKVSVIVPIYNVEGYLNQCIESIINQNHKNLEIILVDDGSTDNSGNICDSFAKKDSRIVAVHKSNSGVVSARKTGAQIATGEYIVSVDGDDWIDQMYIENFVKLLEVERKDVVWSISYYKEKEKSSEYCLAKIENDIQLKEVQEEILKRVSGNYGFQNEIEYSICNKCINRSMYYNIQNRVDNDLTRGEDLYFSVALLENTDNILFCRNDGYHYVQRETSNTNNKSGYSEKKFDILKTKLREFSKELTSYKKTLNNIIDGYLISTYMLYFFGMVSDKKIDFLYPFEKIKKNSKVIIYGAGCIGINIISYLNSVSNYEVVLWIDREKNERRVGKWKVESVEQIIGLQYDYVILATNRTSYIREMKYNLKELGVQDEKMISAFDGINKSDY